MLINSCQRILKFDDNFSSRVFLLYLAKVESGMLQNSQLLISRMFLQYNPQVVLVEKKKGFRIYGFEKTNSATWQASPSLGEKNWMQFLKDKSVNP